VKRMMSDQELDALHESFAAVLAECEIAFPMNWCTITHHLLLHITEKYKDFGAFWAHNNLPIERLYVKLKNLARSCIDVDLVFLCSSCDFADYKIYL
jgi:hypothetical protein